MFAFQQALSKDEATELSDNYILFLRGGARSWCDESQATRVLVAYHPKKRTGQCSASNIMVDEVSAAHLIVVIGRARLAISSRIKERGRFLRIRR